MAFEFATFCNPSFQQSDLLSGQLLTTFRWRHFFFCVGREDSFDQFALIGLTGSDRAEFAIGTV